MTTESTVEHVIEPNRNWLTIPWREIFDYRDLLYLLVRRDFVAQFKQTVLGPIWFLLQPLLMTLVYTVVFTRVARIPTDELPPVLFYMCGTVAWQYFAKCFGGTATTFVGQAHLFGKVYFPRLLVPFSVAISGVFAFALQLLMFLGFVMYFELFTVASSTIQFRPAIVYLPLIVIQMALCGLGAGLWLSALTAKYRDFAHLLPLFTQVWMYLTPVIYPFSRIPENLRWVSALNPVTSIVEWFRFAFLGAGTLCAPYVCTSVVITLAMFFSGLLMFNRAERTFIDTV
jgi:lipopolysaccharide transport system permease protein